ncbi:RNA polymerase II nuclear import protein Rtp1 [Schizosaccharomyces pombe]|uniref:RNA polymerase II assembly factor rtp1 n=1 Tax=Schizosaccharomyces pombe (strain 972 / ATCC 24843) TaxID=284812 RepID=RTP1_SCHPO|nr:uncharacterized protein SPBC20F10.08c [Schizosaccharomyces pombe]O42977.1 RecName: Full=RNA polymerase II assembly factor rtp1 [Schizosaccharomyces pombe 972h-]CAA16848.1 conserved eukaryotic protein [Schizosaccharomyces pombe]|eukprot:NP_596372.1 uncharacterized protein SPBC20F10.08c [Schizosaccharomyces pombe]
MDANQKLLDFAKLLNQKNDSRPVIEKLKDNISGDLLNYFLNLLEEISKLDTDQPLSVTSLRCLQLFVHLTFLLGVYTQLPKEMLSQAKIKALPIYTPKKNLVQIYNILLPLLLTPSLLQGPLNLHYADLLLLHLYLLNCHEQGSLIEEPRPLFLDPSWKEKVTSIMSPQMVDPSKMISSCLSLLQPNVDNWLQDKLKHYLTTCLCRETGVQGFLKVYMQAQPNSIERARQAAHLISSVPKDISPQKYFSCILPQVWSLFSTQPRLASQLIIAVTNTHCDIVTSFLLKKLQILEAPKVIDLSPFENALDVLQVLVYIQNDDIIRICESCVPSLLHLQENTTLRSKVQDILLRIISVCGTKSLLRNLTNAKHLRIFCERLTKSQLAMFLPNLLEIWVQQPPDKRLELLELVQYALSNVDSDEIPSNVMLSVCTNLINEVASQNKYSSTEISQITTNREVEEENEEILLVLLNIISSVIGRNAELDLENPISSLLPALEQLSNYSNREISDLAKDVYKTLIQSKDDYSLALSYTQSDLVPVRGQGVYMLRKLIEKKDDRINPVRVLHVLINLLRDENSYVHLNVISAVVSLCDKYDDSLIRLLKEYTNTNKFTVDETLLIGQAIYQTMERQGELVAKFYGQIEQTCLSMLNNENTDIKISSLNIARLLCQMTSSDAFIESAKNILILEMGSDKQFLRRAAVQLLDSCKHLPDSVITTLSYVGSHDKDDFIKESCLNILANQADAAKYYLQ